VIEKDGSFLADMMVFACESVGHHCLVFEDIVHLTRVLHAVRIDAILVDVDRRGLSTLSWLEIMVPSWPDLPERTLLMTESELAPTDMDRVRALGAQIVPRPRSLIDVEIVVIEHLLRRVSFDRRPPTAPLFPNAANPQARAL
jgi:hypothetical protein